MTELAERPTGGPAGLDLGRWARLIPAEVLANVDLTEPRPVEWWRDPEGARRDMLQARQEAARTRWERICPAKYREARIEALEPAQDPDRVLSRWLDEGGQNLLLAGTGGSGKTFAAHAIAHQAAQRGIITAAYTMPALNEAANPRADGVIWRDAVRATLLIVDDLGRERVTEYTLEKLFALVDERAVANRRTIWTTNLPYDVRGFRWDRNEDAAPESRPNLIDRYGGPVIDRIMDDVTCVAFQLPTRRRPAPPF